MGFWRDRLWRNLHCDEEESIVNGKEGTKACPPKQSLRFSVVTYYLF